MKLERDTNYNGRPSKGYCCQEAKCLWQDDEHPNQVGATFNSFGNGSRSDGSDFVVYLNWRDVEEAILLLAEGGNPEAIRLQNARKLGDAVEQFLAVPQSN